MASIDRVYADFNRTFGQGAFLGTCSIARVGAVCEAMPGVLGRAAKAVYVRW